VRKLLFAALTCAFVTVPAFADGGAAPAAVAVKGKTLIAANGARLGQIYRVQPDGSAQLILEGSMVTVPASTLSLVDGQLKTSMTKNDLIRH
jgi:hypothetical protein